MSPSSRLFCSVRLRNTEHIAQSRDCSLKVQLWWLGQKCLDQKIIILSFDWHPLWNVHQHVSRYDRVWGTVDNLYVLVSNYCYDISLSQCIGFIKNIEWLFKDVHVCQTYNQTKVGKLIVRSRKIFSYFVANNLHQYVTQCNNNGQCDQLTLLFNPSGL